MSYAVKKARRLWPLPADLKELNEPHCSCNRKRYSRCVLFKEGYVVGSGKNPTIDIKSSSPSNILNDL